MSSRVPFTADRGRGYIHQPSHSSGRHSLEREIFGLRSQIAWTESQTQVADQRIQQLVQRRRAMANEIHQFEAQLLSRNGELPPATTAAPRPEALYRYVPKVPGIQFDRTDGILDIDHKTYLRAGRGQFGLIVDHLKYWAGRGCFVRTLRICPLHELPRGQAPKRLMTDFLGFLHDPVLKRRLSRLELLPPQGAEKKIENQALAVLATAICSRKRPMLTPSLTQIKVDGWEFKPYHLAALFGSTQEAPSSPGARKGSVRMPLCEKVSHFEMRSAAIDEDSFLGFLRAVFPGHGQNEHRRCRSRFRTFSLTGNVFACVPDVQLRSLITHLRGCCEIDLSSNGLLSLAPIVRGLQALRGGSESSLRTLDLSRNSLFWEEVIQALPHIVRACPGMTRLVLKNLRGPCTPAHAEQIRRILTEARDSRLTVEVSTTGGVRHLTSLDREMPSLDELPSFRRLPGASSSSSSSYAAAVDDDELEEGEIRD